MVIADYPPFVMAEGHLCIMPEASPGSHRDEEVVCDHVKEDWAKRVVQLSLMNKLSLIILFLMVHFATWSQTLDIPARPAGAKSGTQVIDAIANLSLQDRESVILNEVLSGNIPNFYRTLVPIQDSALIHDIYKKVLYYTIPDYLALGHDTSYFLCPMTPLLAQRIADSLHCILPTRKMVNTIWSKASVKMEPQPIPPSPQMTTVPVFAEHNTKVWTQRQAFLPAKPLGSLVAGNKKDVVISNLIHTSPAPFRVVIYGWHYPTGENIQPLYAGHNNSWADYSHGIRLVLDKIWVDGIETTAKEVLASPILFSLLSDEGVLAEPYYKVDE